MIRTGGLISILLPDLRGGGVERIRITLAHEFVRAGYEVEFVLRRTHGELLEEARKSFSVVDLKAARVRNLPQALFRYLRHRRPEVLIAAMWPLTFIAPVVVRSACVSSKVLVSEHGILSAQYGDWGFLHRIALKITTGLGYRLAHHCIGVSNGVVQDMAKLACIPADRFEMIHNPVPPRPNPSVKDVAYADALWGIPPGKRLLTVGTMKAVKNHPLLLRALAKINDPEVRLMFVGQGECRDKLYSLARELGIIDRIIFAGFQSNTTPFYLTADLFVLSSNFEGFGNVLVEAMACGTSVVSTNCKSGPSEILEGGRYGRLVPIGDSAAMAKAILESLKSRLDQKFLQQRASEFTPNIAARKYLDLIET